MMQLSRATSRLSSSTSTSAPFSTFIKSIKGREILDSRGNPTVEVDLYTNENKLFRASVPSGASTGIYEAVELRDKANAKRYLGKGVTQAVQNVNELSKKLEGIDVKNQLEVDQLLIQLDGTNNKGKFGANAILGISLALSKAGADANQVPLYKYYKDLLLDIKAKNNSKYTDDFDVNNTEKFLLPVPSFNVINGGSHAGNNMPFQEFMILPVGANSFKEAMQMGCEIYHTLHKVIKTKYGQDACNVGDEGGFAPPILDVKDGLDLLMESIIKAGYEKQVKIGMDVAASEFYNSSLNKYDLNFKVNNNKNDALYSGEEFINFYSNLIKEYPIISIEDPFDQDDWESYTKLSATMAYGYTKNPDAIQIVGDDLLVTNPSRIETAIQKKACNALLLKVNQIGTITESIQAVNKAKEAGWNIMASHRSGETEDNYLADLSVGLNTRQIKTGAPCRSERLAKYNQLLRIEEELQALNLSEYAGKKYNGSLWKN